MLISILKYNATNLILYIYSKNFINYYTYITLLEYAKALIKRVLSSCLQNA